MGLDGMTAWPRGLYSASPGVDPCDAPAPSVSHSCSSSPRQTPLRLILRRCARAERTVPAALEVARRAPGAELFRSAGGHYDVYEGGTSFADVLRTEIAFLHRHAKAATPKVA